MRLKDKVALITGGTSGIGRATALLFAAEGAKVAFTGRRADRGKAVAAEIKSHGGTALFIHADHAHWEDCQRSMQEARTAFGRVDILFNNAGLVVGGLAEETSEEEWAEIMNVNVTGVWRMCKLAIPLMRAQGGGVIVNNASDWGLVAGRNSAAYCATKGAVEQMTRAMAVDHAREGIRINAVCPGDTFVERWTYEGYHRHSAEIFQETLKAMGEALPMGRVGRAEEIAKAVLFLASDDSSFMTGAMLVVDGGNTAI
jgi:NAD(P)-dependent dehydrogenase (short-subunit alcohol dehydrogenase family)